MIRMSREQSGAVLRMEFPALDAAPSHRLGTARPARRQPGPSAARVRGCRALS